MRRIYLDYAATTPLLPSVREAMAPWVEAEFGNPSSLYAEGRRAKAAIDEAREILSEALGCLFAEVIFTSSGTEAANLAIVGAALANESPARNRILMSAAEHHCVLHTRPVLERLGYRVDLIPVDRIARIDLNQLERMLGPDVLMVCAMSANNELGTLQPVSEITPMARRHGALHFCDAVQTLPLFHFSGAWSLKPSIGLENGGGGRGVEVSSPDLVAYSAHKIGGPKGAGALVIRAGTRVKPLLVGGGQEREMRAGTENVAAIVGFAAAVRNLHPPPPSRARTSPHGEGGMARDIFLDALLAGGFVPTVPDRRDALPRHAHVRLPGADAETMLINLDRLGLSASSGAACSSGSLEPSHVLLACGYSSKEAREGLRFSFGPDTSPADAEEAARRVLAAAPSFGD